MKYCTQCGSEYEDAVTACADDGNTEFASAEEMRRRELPTAEARDVRRFVRVGEAEDPLSAQRFAAALDAESIPAITRSRRGSAVDALTTPSMTPWWDILVPEEHVQKASLVLAEAQREIDAGADESARAAEEEAGQS